jgi:hypothetical protein
MRRVCFGDTMGGHTRSMTFGGSLFLLALGAILRYAVKDAIDGIDLATVGLILMVAGAVGFVIALYLNFVRRDRLDGRVVEERVVERERY